jgi:hypothetical protein
MASNTVVADVEMVASLIAGLNESPDLFQALQFVTLAEAVVLRDGLIVISVSDGSTEDLIERAEERSVVESYLSPLIEGGAVTLEQLEVAPAEELPRTSDEHSHVVEAEDDPIANVAVMAGRGLTAERVRSKPALTLPMQQIFYESSANVRADHSICDLSGRYKSLAKTLYELRERARIDATKYEVVPLPPIGLSVFRHAKTVDGLPNALIEVREEFGDLRARLGDLQRILDDPDVPPNKKWDLRRRWIQAWQSLDTKYDLTSHSSSSMNLADTNSAIYKLAPEVPAAMGFSPAAWTNLVKAAVEEWPALWSRWRMRALHRTMKSYLDSPDKALGDAVEKIIKRPIPDDEIREVKEVQTLMTQFTNSVVTVYRDEEPA